MGTQQELWALQPYAWVRLYQCGGGRVEIFLVDVALGIIGLHDACQPSIQCDVGLCIRGEDEQVRSIIPPANFFLQ